MSILADRRARRTPWHLWVVGVLSLLWNAVGAADFTLTQMQHEPYMSNFTPEQLEYFYGFPIWVIVCWGIAVWGGVLGSILLLMRRRPAALAFFVSLLAMIATSVHNLLLSNGLAVMGDTAAWFSALIFVIALALFVYAGIMNRRNILR